MSVKALPGSLERSNAPARISPRTHRELRCVALLSAAHGRPVTMRGLIDQAWEAYKQQRPDIVALLLRIEHAQEREEPVACDLPMRRTPDPRVPMHLGSPSTRRQL